MTEYELQLDSFMFYCDCQNNLSIRALSRAVLTVKFTHICRDIKYLREKGKGTVVKKNPKDIINLIIDIISIN